MTEDIQGTGGGREVNFLLLVRVVHRWRRLVLGLTFTLALAAAVVMVLTPNRYTARGTILLEVDEGGGAIELLGQLTAFTGFSPQTPIAEIYLAILGSERLARAVIEELELIDRYEIEGETAEQRMDTALLVMENKVDVEVPDRVTLLVSATDNDPQLAADIVNAYLGQLEVANQTLSLSRSRRTRLLVEKALTEAGVEFESARTRMRHFQNEYGAFSLDEQTRATLELVAQLQGRLIEARTEREAVSGFRREDASQLRNLDLRIDALERQISDLVGDFSAEADTLAAPRSALREGEVPPDAEEDRYLLPLSRIPALADRYASILMDLEVQKAKYTVLATKLEQTKIEESQSVPSFEILDRAERPYRKSGPFRTVFVLGAIFGGLLAGVLLAVLLDDLSHRVDAETREELLAMLPGFLSRRIPGSRGGA